MLQIIGLPELGGIENQVLAFLQRYDRSRFVVDVACTARTTGALRDEYLATGAQLIPCRWSRYVVPFVWRLQRLLKRERYDVVHAQASEVSGAVLLAGKLARVPIRVTSYHHTKTFWSNPGIMNRLVVGMLKIMERLWATRILGVSEACLDVYHPNWRKHPQQFQLCYDGIALKWFTQKFNRSEIRSELNLPANSLVVGHVGSLRQAKNHRTIVDVAERIARQLENVYFLMVGDGALQRQIKMDVQSRGLTSRFVFTGARKDVPRMLAAMDVFVMPSISEGFGIAVAEAQLSGLPVVASNLPSIREALCPEMHEFCRDPLDSKGLAEQVLLLLLDQQLRTNLGRKGREYVSRKFSIDKTVEQLESLYDSAVAND